MAQTLLAERGATRHIKAKITPLATFTQKIKQIYRRKQKTIHIHNNDKTYAKLIFVINRTWNQIVQLCMFL